MKRNYCAVSSSLFVVAIVASVACLSCIKENLYLIQFFFPHSVPLSNAALFFAACYFYFSFFRSILFFSFIFCIYVYVWFNSVFSFPYLFLLLFFLFSGLFTCKDNVVCRENIHNLWNESMHQKSCRIDFSPSSKHRCHFDTFILVLAHLLYHLLTHACACAWPSMCFYFWHVREEYGWRHLKNGLFEYLLRLCGEKYQIGPMI